MNLNDVMDEVGAQLDTISGLRVFDYPAQRIEPPAGILDYPEIIFDETYGRGMDRMTLPVYIAVGQVSDRASRLTLAPYCSGSGSSSVKAVLEAGTYTAFDVLRVMSVDASAVLTVAGVEYAAALFDVDIIGQGS